MATAPSISTATDVVKALMIRSEGSPVVQQTVGPSLRHAAIRDNSMYGVNRVRRRMMKFGVEGGSEPDQIYCCGGKLEWQQSSGQRDMRKASSVNSPGGDSVALTRNHLVAKFRRGTCSHEVAYEQFHREAHRAQGTLVACVACDNRPPRVRRMV